MPTSRHRRKGVTRPRVRHAEQKHPECPACQDPDYSIEDDWRFTFECIQRNGWYAQGVLGDRAHPPYTYTVGLTLVGHPDLVISGMHPRAGHRELTLLAEAVLAGHRIAGLRELEKACGCVFRFVPVTRGAIDIGVADVVHGGPAPAIQCVWSDAKGRYPGEPGYDEIRYRQPLLGPAWWLRTAGSEAV